MYQGIIEKIPRGDVSGAWYYFACVAAVAGHRDDAFAYLDKAIHTGFTDIDSLRTEKDLKAIRNDPRFVQMLLAAQRRVG